MQRKIREQEDEKSVLLEKEILLANQMKDSDSSLKTNEAKKKQTEQELAQMREKFRAQEGSIKQREKECMTLLTGVSAQLKIVENLLHDEIQSKPQHAITMNSRVVKYPESLELREYCNMISRDIRTLTHDLQTFVKIKTQFITCLEVEHKRSLESVEKQISAETRTRDKIIKIQVSKAVEVEKVAQAAERKKQSIKHETVLEQIRADHDQIIRERDRFQKVTLDQIKAKHTQEMENLQMMFSMERENLRKEASDEIEKLNVSHETQMKDMESKLESAQSEEKNMKSKLSSAQSRESNQDSELRSAISVKEKQWREKLERVMKQQKQDVEEAERLHGIELDKLRCRLARKLAVARKEWVHERDYMEESLNLIKHQMKHHINAFSKKKSQNSLLLKENQHANESSTIHKESQYRTLLDKYIEKSKR